MAKRYFTVGMAGHIDHGKTSLVKALTNIDTDRLKEERERGISIELGFAPLLKTEEMEVSVVDVPGHERFIRQMIAGVAGIDLVVLVVAADEGVMPQTKEHLEILSFLGIDKGIVVLSKIDKVDEELHSLAKEEIVEELRGSSFEGCPVILADSLSGKGIEELKGKIIQFLGESPSRSVSGDFRMPIDQVFTVKGQGTVVRGTVYEGSVKEGDSLLLLPAGKETRARQIQVHHSKAEEAFGGQRTAINISGISREEAARGDVLVKSEFFTVTDTIDVSIRLVKGLELALKQRMPVKLHAGTMETMGKIVFFDRNEVKEENEEILCQVRLDGKIVVKRNDRIILRRPTPAETVAGGYVIDPNGSRYKFGEDTIRLLKQKKNGTPLQRIEDVLAKFKALPEERLLQESSLSSYELEELLSGKEIIEMPNGNITSYKVTAEMEKLVGTELENFHKENPLSIGMDKARIVQLFKNHSQESILEYVIKDMISQEKWNREGHLLHINGFTPSVPQQWAKRSRQALELLKEGGRKPLELTEYLKDAGIPGELHQSLLQFYREQNLVIPLDDKLAYHFDVFSEAVNDLQESTADDFDISAAKDTLGLSRKFLIPFLETLDSRGYTVRVENKRKWKQRNS
ncbi:selenocysteine-specific translation elongation factor [Bacillus sp. AK031]